MHWEVIDKNRYNILKKVVETIGELEVTVCRKGTVHAILNGVQLTFLYFKNKNTTHIPLQIRIT